MKKYFIKISLIAALFAGVFISCSDNDNEEPWVKPVFSTKGAFILNEGQWTVTKSKLSYYDTEESKLTANIFENQNNGMTLGDGAQDILVYGSKIYIVVMSSNTIFITDLEGKLIAEKGIISTAETEYKNPRYLAAYDGHVYVDFHTGHLAKLDTIKLEVIDKIAIPHYSEEMTVVKNELYIANSKYDNTVEGNTVTVVNLNNFKIEKAPIEVRVNPYHITNDKLGNVFVTSLGIYKNPDYKQAISIIDTKTQKTEVIGEEIGRYITVLNNKLLIANRIDVVDENWVTQSSSTEYNQYDIYTKELSKTAFTGLPEEEAVQFGRAYSLSIDPNNNDIYVATTDYKTTGTVYVFSSNGAYKTHFKTGGVSPQKIAFLTEQTN